MDSTNKIKLEKFSKELSILHYAMTLGTFMATAVIYFFTVKDGQFNFSDTGDFFLYICPILAVGGVLLGGYLFENKLKETKSMDSIDDKLNTYRAAKVVKFAFIEGPALVCAIALLQTQNLLYLVMGLLLIAYLFSQKISTSRIEEELNIF